MCASKGAVPMSMLHLLLPVALPMAMFQILTPIVLCRGGCTGQ